MNTLNIKVNIPTLIPEEQSHANLPLGEKQDSATTDQSKVPWKPRITLMAEITDLVDWGMTDNYEQESDNSAAAEVPSTEADTSPPLKREKPILLLDTPFSDKYGRDGSFQGKQPSQHFTYGSSP